MNPEVLSKYRFALCSVNAKADRVKGRAPHKPLLLLSLLDEIERGHLTENRVFLSAELIVSFWANWQALPTGGWQPLSGAVKEPIFNPFYYLANDKDAEGRPFWFLTKDGGIVPANEANKPRSLNALRQKIDFACFAPELWQLLQDATARAALRRAIILKFFGTPEPSWSADHLFQMQVERLIAEAQSQPRIIITKVREQNELYHVRHWLFPETIRAAYGGVCAVCRLGARTDHRSLIEAAHIRPFAEFHDDHPSNGLALCKNHHWAFDAGAFAVNDDYTVRISPGLQNAAGLLTGGVKLHLPSAENCIPNVEALAWHRENRYLW